MLINIPASRSEVWRRVSVGCPNTVTGQRWPVVVTFTGLLVLACIPRHVLGTASETKLPPQDGTASRAANVLFIAPFGSKSHKIFYDGVIEAIADGGHKVTVLTPFKASRKHKNIKSVVFENNDIATVMPNSFSDGILAATLNAMEKGPAMCFSALSAQKTKSALLKKYDLIFVSVFFNECFLGAVHSMKVPIVFVNPAEMHPPYMASRMGNPSFPSFSYNPMLNFEVPLTFAQRLVSMFSEITLEWMIATSFTRIDVTGNSLQLFPPSTPPTAEISANASLFIVNSQRLLEHPRPYMPNILLAGGIHCRPPQPLSKDLEQWVAAAGNEGFIYFSLGSAVSSQHLPDQTVVLIMSVFVSLRQRVLWKHDRADELKSVAENVRLVKWAPQQDILGDSRIRLFITHGGLLSTQEATYHGVPVLGLPVFGDQEGNMAGAESQGWGRKLSWSNITAESLAEAIQDLIQDKKYAKNVRARGALMRDVPSSAPATVLWWTEYLLRTGGAPHLRSGAALLPWYQLYNCDVWLVILSLVVLLVWLVLILFKKLFHCCCGQKAKKHTTKIKKS